jgi:hypothetical protein
VFIFVITKFSLIVRIVVMITEKCFYSATIYWLLMVRLEISVDISPVHFEMLQKVSEKLGISVRALLEQELSDALSNAEVWIQRAELLL